MTETEQRIARFMAKSKHYGRIATAVGKVCSAGEDLYVDVIAPVLEPGFIAYVGPRGMIVNGMGRGYRMAVKFDANGRYRGYETSAGVRSTEGSIAGLRRCEETIMTGDWGMLMRPSEKAAKLAKVDA
jgi:hypothetical protein